MTTKIIDGLRYNTDKATKLDEVGVGYSIISLWRTPNNRYFAMERIPAKELVGISPRLYALTEEKAQSLAIKYGLNLKKCNLPEIQDA